MTTADSAMDGLSPHEHRAQLRRAVIASTIGTTIEWYDFFIYGTVTGLVFPKLYFPESDPLVGTLEAFAIYAVGFVARPVGAAIFGHYGDRIGRRAALIATLLTMGIATFLAAIRRPLRAFPRQFRRAGDERDRRRPVSHLGLAGAVFHQHRAGRDRAVHPARRSRDADLCPAGRRRAA